MVRHLGKTKKVQKLTMEVKTCIPKKKTLWPVDFKKSEDHPNLEMNASHCLYTFDTIIHLMHLFSFVEFMLTRQSSDYNLPSSANVPAGRK